MFGNYNEFVVQHVLLINFQEKYKIKMNPIATALLLASISIAHAETANQPVSQGAASVNKNLSKDPDNKGLQNASGQLKENEEKVDENRAASEEERDHAKHKKDKNDKHDRMGKGNHDKMDHNE
jgi:hypothetical protein